MKARSLLVNLRTLEPGRSTFEDAERVAKLMSATPSGFVPCNHVYCEWVSQIDNSKIPRWWRGRGETFGGVIRVKDSTVELIGAGFTIGVLGKESVDRSAGFQEQENWGRRNLPVPIAAGWSSSDVYLYRHFGVYMTTKASAEDKRRYAAFNFNCFWKYKGCADGRELMPISTTYRAEYPR